MGKCLDLNITNLIKQQQMGYMLWNMLLTKVVIAWCTLYLHKMVWMRTLHLKIGLLMLKTIQLVETPSLLLLQLNFTENMDQLTTMVQ